MKKIKKVGSFIATNKSSRAYKSDRSYYNALFNKNKERITAQGYNKKMFADKMLEIQYEFKAEGEVKTRRQAAYEFSRTREFMSRDEIMMENIRGSVKRDVSNEIRRIQGWKRDKKIDWSNFHYNKETKRMEDTKNNIWIKIMRDHPEDEHLVTAGAL